MDYPKQTDEELMQGVQMNQADAARHLFERYKNRIYGLFRQLTYGDTELSEDLTQDVFERMIRYRSSFRQGNSFRNWLFQIARNVQIDHVKARKRQEILSQEGQSFMQDAMDPYLTIFKQEENDRLHRAINRLKSTDRELIYLSKFEKMKYRDISQITGQSENSVKVAVHRALKQLKNEFFNPKND